MADERDEIRSRIDIVDLVGQRVSLKRTGKTFKGLCPFHDDRNPSFTVDPTTGRYRCWSCGEAGDAFTWLMKTQGMTFVEALKELAQRTGVQLKQVGETTDRSVRDAYRAQMSDALVFFQEQLGRNEGAKAYCQRRGLTAEVLARWEIGFAPDVGEALATQLKRKGHALTDGKLLFLVDQDGSGGYFDKFRGRLMFPIRDERGELVAFGGRLLGDGHPKYINSSDTPLYRKSRVLYGAHRAKDAWSKDRTAVLVEGYLDVIACHEGGLPQAVASLGTALSEEHAKLLSRWVDEVVILYDRDAAGIKAARRAVEILKATELRVRVAVMPEGDDPDTLLKKSGPAALQEVVRDALAPLAFALRTVEEKESPDSPEYWEAVVDVLADSDSDLEHEANLSRLAGLYPGTRDINQAIRTLKRMILQRKKQKREARRDPGGAIEQEERTTKRAITPMQSAEVEVFRAFLDSHYRRFAWMTATRMEHLLITETAISLAAALKAAFPSAPPEGEPAAWLHRIESEDLQQVLSDLSMMSVDVPLTDDWIADAVKRLQTEAQKRQLSLLKRGETTPEERLEILKRLRELNVDPKLKAKAADEDPFS